jgi:hypothetical protein
MKIADGPLENVAEITCFGTTVANHNLILGEFKSRLNSSNACCQSVKKETKNRTSEKTA